MFVNVYVRRKLEDGVKPDAIHLYPDGYVLAWQDLKRPENWADVFGSFEEAKKHFKIEDFDLLTWELRFFQKVDCKGCVECKAVIPLNDQWDDHSSNCAKAERMKEADRTKARSEALLLIRLVYEAVFDRTESFDFDDVGVDLAYLLGAIARNSFVEWERKELPTLHEILKQCFPQAEHPVWSFVVIHEEEITHQASAP